MAQDLTPIVDWIEQRLAAGEVIPEVLESFSGLSELDAYRVQRDLIARRVAAGDRPAGFKAAMTSKAMREAVGLTEPVMGRLLASGMLEDGAAVDTAGFVKPTVEPEVAVVMKRRLAGPGITRAEALAAIEGYLPAIEIGDIKTGENKRSPQMTLVCNVMNGGQALGGRMHSPSGIDLRLEGMVVTINGEVRGSATAVEVLGDPVNSVAFIANKLGELDEALEPGMVLLTGSIVRGIPVGPGDQVHVGFTRIGDVSLRFG